MEFDEKAAEDASRRHALYFDEINHDFVMGARWQFERDKDAVNEEHIKLKFKCEGLAAEVARQQTDKASLTMRQHDILSGEIGRWRLMAGKLAEALKIEEAENCGLRQCNNMHPSTDKIALQALAEYEAMK